MKGILFKPDMIKAIRECRKTVTRRLDHLKEINKDPTSWSLFDIQEGIARFKNKWSNNVTIIKPRYQVGEVVYIKEAWAVDSGFDNWKPREIYTTANVWYPLGADLMNIPDWVGRLRSPMFLRECFARYFIQITDVRAERLQEIGHQTHDDVLREGYPFSYDIATLNEHPTNTFARYWDSINPKYPWESNPWVWRYEFIQHKGEKR